jgi:excisionase family DNA binding protein
MDPILPALMTAGQVAEILIVDKATVYAAAATGRIPSVVVWKGKKRSLLRFRREDIEALLRRRSV